ncbi:hypothetical protein ColTof4_06902 [Colletotrichum tofieldiae]|nr:hypothetical protein ColTof3_11847 [Colletotrichum tofieldiae]GKT74479.1 hypothetical protein ColTof4_06902 [Colletotrichum tofieldiae]
MDSGLMVRSEARDRLLSEAIPGYPPAGMVIVVVVVVVVHFAHGEKMLVHLLPTLSNSGWCFFGGVVLSRGHRSMSSPLLSFPFPMWRHDCATGLALADGTHNSQPLFAQPEEPSKRLVLSGPSVSLPRGPEGRPSLPHLSFLLNGLAGIERCRSSGGTQADGTKAI